MLLTKVRLSKVLNLKKEKISGLREMNTEAERKESIGESVAQDFQRRYARTILDLEELNTELNSLLTKVRLQCSEVNFTHPPCRLTPTDLNRPPVLPADRP